MAFSYSFHLSSKGHSVGTIGKIEQVSKHNLRAYKSNEYDRDLISVLAGSESSVLDSVRKVYEDEFSGVLEEYNRGKRADRQISDYLKHVSQSRNDVAAEIIIQIGDKEFWQDKTPEQFKSMDKVFQGQLADLEQLLPSFKIASAVVHYDEASPHMHVVGVPVAEGGSRGMKKQCVKTKVFTKDSLEMLQDKMRLRAEQHMDSMPELFAGMELKEKKKGRNKDLPKKMLDEFYTTEKELNGQITALEGHIGALEKKKVELVEEEEIRAKKALEKEKELSDKEQKLQKKEKELESRKKDLQAASEVYNQQIQSIQDLPTGNKTLTGKIALSEQEYGNLRNIAIRGILHEPELKEIRKAHQILSKKYNDLVQKYTNLRKQIPTIAERMAFQQMKQENKVLMSKNEKLEKVLQKLKKIPLPDSARKLIDSVLPKEKSQNHLTER